MGKCIEEKQPTCVKNGYRIYKCTYCAKTKTEQIKTVKHDFGEGVIAKEATESKMV